MRRRVSVTLLALSLLAPWIPACSVPPERAATEPERLRSEQNLLTGVPSRTSEGRVNVVVEIPAGTNAKWETAKDGDGLVWERKDGAPRVVRYLPYPSNYGMVPGTRLPVDDGGDGDPLDVLLLGPARPRGAIVPARLIGVMRLLDRGEQDDKLLAVDPDGPLGDVRDLAELDAAFPGATAIVETWFSHYKGPGKIETRGFGGRDAALAILEAAERTDREQRAAD